MKHTAFLSFCILSIAMLSACEEVIQLDLDTTEQQVVVEANLDAGADYCLVKLSKSGGFYETNEFPMVENAQVQIVINHSSTIQLEEQTAGNYSADVLDVFPGDVVQLQVTLPDNRQISSNEVVVPAPVTLDTLFTKKTMPGSGLGGGGNSEEKYSLSAAWWDLAGASSYYRLKIFENNRPITGLYILADDRLGDGDYITRPVIRQTFEAGDTLRCQLLSVNKGYYDYFTDLANSDGRGLSSPAPFNPKGNLQNAVLGYFGVWYGSEKTIVAQE